MNEDFSKLLLLFVVSDKIVDQLKSEGQQQKSYIVLLLEFLSGRGIFMKKTLIILSILFCALTAIFIGSSKDVGAKKSLDKSALAEPLKGKTISNSQSKQEATQTSDTISTELSSVDALSTNSIGGDEKKHLLSQLIKKEEVDVAVTQMENSFKSTIKDKKTLEKITQYTKEFNFHKKMENAYSSIDISELRVILEMKNLPSVKLLTSKQQENLSYIQDILTGKKEYVSDKEKVEIIDEILVETNGIEIANTMTKAIVEELVTQRVLASNDKISVKEARSMGKEQSAPHLKEAYAQARKSMNLIYESLDKQELQKMRDEFQRINASKATQVLAEVASKIYTEYVGGITKILFANKAPKKDL